MERRARAQRLGGSRFAALRRRRLLRTSASVAHVLAPSASVVVSLLAVRGAGVAVWGAFVAAMIVVRLTAQVVNFGARDHLLRRFSEDPAGIGEAWRRNVASRMWLAVPAPALFLLLGAPPDRAATMTVWLLAIVIAQSHDALVSYRRAFGFALGLELLAVTLTCVGVLALGGGLTPDRLILISTAAAVLRAGGLAARFRVLRAPSRLRAPEVAELRASWPFFALTFSGAVGSRIDLYVVAALLPAVAVGEYALLTTFVLLVQSVAAALVSPVVPSLYRLSRGSVIAATLRLLAVGVPLTLGGAVGTWLLLHALYGVSLPPLPIAAAWLAMLPCYLYLPLVYLAFRLRRERWVLASNGLGIVVGAVGTLVLAPGLGIGGAMLAAAMAQVAIAAFHVLSTMRPPMDEAPGDATAVPVAGDP